MFDPKSVRFRGPLAPLAVGFFSELLRLEYAPLSARNLLLVAAHFSRWLKKRSLGVVDITDARAASFALHRRQQGYARFLSPRALQPLLRYLRDVGVVAVPTPVVLTPVERFIRDYTDYLSRERGLAASTIRGYGDFARRFINERAGGAKLKWEQLKPTDVTTFVLEEAGRWSVGQVKHVVSSLRSLLRYLHKQGSIGSEMASCVPAVAGWRLSGLPKALEPDQVLRILQSCDQQSAIGRRNAAIIRLMLRLGLRAGDIATLALDDIDWRAGELVLRGKSRRESRLPLPRDVGRCLAAYLRHVRPRTKIRQVFLRTRAPYTSLTAGGVIGTVRCVLRRAGVSGGTHQLRHTTATEMLRHGASLPEIGDVLRHRHLDTTAIYAKVDFTALHALAQPWPGDAS